MPIIIPLHLMSFSIFTEKLRFRILDLGFDKLFMMSSEIRKILLDFLVCEKAGTGNKENTSKYRYNVELLACGNKIYLTRPVPLNKGFDFVIHVENYLFMNGTGT